jgi:NADPH2:quinone reductase
MRVRAARLIAHDRPLEIEEVDLPDPGPGEVVVDMAYGGINPVDGYQARGLVAPDAPLPRTLGSEGSGTVEGRPVLVRGGGLWATAAVVARSRLVEIPDGVDLRTAGGIGVAGVTAWRCVVDKGGVGPADRVLVLAGSGGVGSAAVSLARSLGATVWAQTGDEAKAEWIAARGAERVVVTDAAGLAASVAELEPTVVIDPLGGGFTGAAIEALAAHGRLVLLGTSAGAIAEVPLQRLYRKGIDLRGYGGLIEPEETLAAAAAATLQAAASGRLEVVVDRVLPLEEVNHGFELLASRAVRGKLLVDLRA